MKICCIIELKLGRKYITKERMIRVTAFEMFNTFVTPLLLMAVCFGIMWLGVWNINRSINKDMKKRKQRYLEKKRELQELYGDW